MSSSNNYKRNTRVSPSQVALLQEALPKNGAETGSSAPEPKLTPRPLQFTKHRAKSSTKYAPGNPSSHVSRSLPGLPALQENSKLESDTSRDMAERHECPWESLERGYECDLAGPVAVCVPLRGEREICTIRQFSGKQAESVLRIVRFLRHRNVTSIRECFRTEEALYTLSEFDPITLDHVVACKQYPKPNQLASLMSQVCLPMIYLSSEKLSMRSYSTDSHI